MLVFQQGWQLMGTLTNLRSPPAFSDVSLCVRKQRYQLVKHTFLWCEHLASWQPSCDRFCSSCDGSMLFQMVKQPCFLASLFVFCCTPGWKPICPFNQWTGRWIGAISYIFVHVRAEILAQGMPASQPWALNWMVALPWLHSDTLTHQRKGRLSSQSEGEC